MKTRRANVGVLIALLGLLAGCEITFVDDVSDDYEVNRLEIYDARYTTNYRDDDGRNYICDNLETPLTYEFSYDGDLASWKLYLEGSRGGLIESKRLTPQSSSVEVAERGYIRDRYAVPRYTAPLSVQADLETQDIIVVFEPYIIGESKLYLEVEDVAGRTQTFETKWLPVADNCP